MAAEESVDGPYYLEKVLIPEDSEDEYTYDEVSVDDELSITEGEEDLETAVPEVVDDFLRNYLVKMGMKRTLDCFQTEWFEMIHKGLIKTDQMDFVPDAYTHNQLLENELKNIQRERDSYKQAAFEAGETIVKLQRERDFHRMQHKRLVQEKDRLIEDIKKLKKHYASYEPALRQLNDKYQTAVRQKMLVSLERDRAFSQVQNLDSDFAKGRCMLSLEGHIHATWACSFHSCGDFVASCSMDNTAKVWDLNSERCRCTLRGHVDSVNSISFLPFSNILLTCSADKTLSLWDARAGLCAQTFYGHKHSCNYAAFNATGDTIASCDSFGVVKLWDVRNVSAMVSIDTGPHPSNQVAFSPNGRMLAVASNDGSVKTVEVASLHMSSLIAHDDAVQSVIFDHKGEYILSAGSDGAIHIWS
ncbi:hypothetical protein PO909_008321 [Leuciscus waleckii]